ncbi:hypothetical protein DM02DRAFT_535904, partial [Periconia macrospinosa]
RRRKIRCTWPSEASHKCSYCEGKGLLCEAQTVRTPGPDVVRVTTRARLVSLERNQASIWTAIRELQAQNRIARADPSQTPHQERSSRPSSGLHFNTEDDMDDDTDKTDDLSPGPTHLLQLFNNNLLNSDSHEIAQVTPTPFKHTANPQKAQACAALRALMPSHADMTAIATFASSMLPLYASLLPMFNINTSPEAMVALHGELQHRDDPVALSTFLMYIALTVRYAPTSTTFPTSESMKNLSTFVKNVSNTVEKFVIADDAVAGTIEGIEAALLFLRLQLGRVRVTKMWLQLRRVIALAELLGLPRAAAGLASLEATESTNSSPQISHLKQRAQAWESICALDRITSMLSSLPLATANYPLPERPLLDSTGKVNAQAYLYSLAGIASQVHDLEGIKSSQRSQSDLFNAVMRTDHELRSLASSPRKEWWDMRSPTDFDVDLVIQYWHKYFTVRTHLQLALAYDGENEQFAFNYITCLNASQELATRYLSLRPTTPTGFFANWVIDMQVFTGVVFLQLASYRVTQRPGLEANPHGFDVSGAFDLIDQVVKTLESSTGRAGGDFAQQAATVIRSLHTLLQRSQLPEPQRISLSLPLIGTIQISRRSPSPLQTATATQVQPQSSGNETFFLNTSAEMMVQSTPQMSEGMDLMDSFSYSMEFPESYPFPADDSFSAWMQ